MPVHLSPSRLNLFAECPRCFWLRVNERIERPSGPFPSLPGGMDRTIKDHFDRFRAEGTLPPELRDEVDVLPDPRIAGLETDQRFLERCRRWQSDPAYVDDALDVAVRGGVDDLLRTEDGSLVVLDYKTRGYPPKGEAGAPAYYARQVNCYNLILRSAGHQTANCGLLLYYYPDDVAADGTFSFNNELRRVAVDVDAVRAEVERAVETLRGPVPDHDPDCEYCGWNAAEHG